MGWHQVPLTRHNALLGTGQEWGQDVSSQPGHTAHSSGWSEGASPSPPGTAEATPKCKQAEPGTPNLKPGTAPGPSVAKKVCWGTACPCSGVTQVPKQLVRGRAACVPETTPLGGAARCFWVHMAEKGEKPSSLPRALSKGNGQTRAAGLQWSGHHMSHFQKQRQGWLEV